MTGIQNLPLTDEEQFTLANAQSNSLEHFKSTLEKNLQYQGEWTDKQILESKYPDWTSGLQYGLGKRILNRLCEFRQTLPKSEMFDAPRLITQTLPASITWYKEGDIIQSCLFVAKPRMITNFDYKKQSIDEMESIIWNALKSVLDSQLNDYELLSMYIPLILVPLADNRVGINSRYSIIHRTSPWL